MNKLILSMLLLTTQVGFALPRKAESCKTIIQSALTPAHDVALKSSIDFAKASIEAYAKKAKTFHEYEEKWPTVKKGSLDYNFRQLQNRLVDLNLKGEFSSLTKMKAALAKIHPKAAALADQIVKKENMLIVMFRKLDPIDLIKEDNGLFLNLWRGERDQIDEEVHNRRNWDAYSRQQRLPDQLVWAARSLFGTSELKAIRDNERDFNMGDIMPKHSALVFKKMPPGIKQKNYGGDGAGATTLYGSDGYGFEFAKFQDRALLTLGDISKKSFSNVAEIVDEDAEYDNRTNDVPSGQLVPEGFSLRESIVKDQIPLIGTTPLSDLRPIYLDVFRTLALGQTVIFDDLDVAEVTIYGQLRVEDATYYTEGFTPLSRFTKTKLEQIKKANPRLRHLQLLDYSWLAGGNE